MNARIWRSHMILVVCLGLPAGYAFAQNRDHGKDKDRDKHEARERREHKEAREHRLGHEREEAREARLRHEREEAREARLRHKREEAREHHIHQGPGYVSPTSTHQPSGWNKGKKAGWGHCDVPPGHAKPADCK